jgi:hypothetical protein
MQCGNGSEAARRGDRGWIPRREWSPRSGAWGGVCLEAEDAGPLRRPRLAAAECAAGPAGGGSARRCSPLHSIGLSPVPVAFHRGHGNLSLGWVAFMLVLLRLGSRTTCVPNRGHSKQVIWNVSGTSYV